MFVHSNHNVFCLMMSFVLGPDKVKCVRNLLKVNSEVVSVLIKEALCTGGILSELDSFIGIRALFSLCCRLVVTFFCAEVKGR